MKKLLLLITGLLLLVSVEGQILRYSNYTEPASPPDFYDEYDTVYAAFATKPHDTIADLQEALVYSLDTAGYWDRMDILYVLASHTEADGLINWISPSEYTATNVSSTTWAQWIGFTGDGTADYLNTNWNPSTDGVNYTQDDGSVGIYVSQDIQEDNVYVFGAYNGTNQTYFRPRSTTGGLGGAINSNLTFAAAGVSTAVGLWIVTRTASNATEVYQDGTSMDSDTDASVGLPNNDMGILNRIGGNGFSSNTVMLFFAMDGMTDAEAIEISDIINIYITAIAQ